MKKKIINKYTTLLAFAFVTLVNTSCEKEIDLNLRSVTPKLVIEGKLIEDSFAIVKLTYTKDYFSNNVFDSIPDADVTITTEDGIFEPLTFNTRTGWYEGTSLRGVAGKDYHLLVKLNGKEYTATSHMPPMVPIDSITFLSFAEGISSYPFPLVHFVDRLGTENNYYRHILYINGRRMSKFDAITNLENTDGIHMMRPIPVFPMANEKDKDPIEKGDVLMIEQQSIDLATCTYYQNIKGIEDSRNNPTSNIKGGALGFFAAYSIDKKDVIAYWK